MDVLGINFNPTNTTMQSNGELTFGGIDNSKLIGPITFTPITQSSPANEFWGTTQSISYSTIDVAIMIQTAGIVDTSSTLIMLPMDDFNRYKTATGAVLDSTTGLLRLPATQFGQLQTLSFHINGASFSLTPNAQIWPRALNTLIGGTNNNVYLIVNNIGTPSGEGLDFILGLTFLERFYCILDTTSGRVGFATTTNTTSMIN